METLADAYLRAQTFIIPDERERVLVHRDGASHDGDAPGSISRLKCEGRGIVYSTALLTETGHLEEAERIERLCVRALLAEATVMRRFAEALLRRRSRQEPPAEATAPRPTKQVTRAEATAIWAAEKITSAAYPRAEVPALPQELTLETCARWLETFATALERAIYREGTVVVPGPLLDGMLDLRAVETAPSSRSRSPITGRNSIQPQVDEVRRGFENDRSYRTFAAGDFAYWRLTVPSGFTLHLPFEKGDEPYARDKRDAGRGVRGVLTGPLLRAYLATWALTGAWGSGGLGENLHGLFEMDARRVLLDLYGLEPRPMRTTKRASRGLEPFARPPDRAERELRENFATLCQCLLEGVGNVTAGVPEPLIQSYEDAPTGRRVHRQAPLAMIALKSRFVQVPREVLRLEPRDTPLALGIARILLAHARPILRGLGRWQCGLEELAREAREPDAADEIRKRGRGPVYRDFAERVKRVVRDGALGKVHLAGDGPDAVVTLEPSGALAEIYSSLAERAVVPPIEVEVAKRLAAPRRPGRPRKGPLQ